MGYNPNRDSGIAYARSFVEIPAENLSGLVEEFDFIPDPTKRYFAQLTYNVGNSMDSPFTETEINRLHALAGIADALIGMSTLSIREIEIPVPKLDKNIADATIEKTNTFMRTVKNNDAYSLVEDIEDFDKDAETTYLLNINRICMRSRMLSLA